jgi:hypothetical protein
VPRDVGDAMLGPDCIAHVCEHQQNNFSR